MRHWLFKVTAAVSLTLCVAMVMLWVRSRWHFDAIGYGSTLDASLRQTSVTVGSQRGEVLVDRSVVQGSTWPRYDPGWHLHRLPVDRHDFMASPDQRGFRLLGFGYLPIGPYTQRTVTQARAIIFVPHWAIVLAFAMLPAWWAISRHGEKRGDTRQCRQCGYDLRATPGRCPECGTVPEARA